MAGIQGSEVNLFKAPRAKKRPPEQAKTPAETWPVRNNIKRRRTKEDFMQFCNIILDYTNYESMRNEDARLQQNLSPMASGGSPVDSYNSDSSANASPTETRQPSPAQPPFLSPPPPAGRGAPGAHSVVIPRKLSPGSASSSPRSGTDAESDDSESYDLITCYCMKPFAGRPMIECHECLTWIHLSCAKIRKTNIPEEFTCQKCRDAKLTTRKSTRQRVEKQNLDA